MASMDWSRLWAGFAADPKWTVVARRSGVLRGVVLGIAAALFEHANLHEDRGSITGLDLESFATLMDVSEDDVTAVLQAMEDKQIIADGRLRSWEKRNPKREDPTANLRQRNRRQHLAEQTEVTSRDDDEPSVTVCDEPDVTHGHAMSRDVTTEKKREEEMRDTPPPPPAHERTHPVVHVVTMTDVERDVVDLLQQVPDMRAIPTANICLHLREVLHLRGGEPIPDARLRLEAQKFRDDWSGPKKQRGSPGSVAPRWKKRITEWFGRIDDNTNRPETHHHRHGRATGGSTDRVTPGTGEIRRRQPRAVPDAAG